MVLIEKSEHTFHIPVLGIGFTVDTPLKVARFGISSVISIVEDELLETMREFHCRSSGLGYVPIDRSQSDSRALRITAYLDLVHRLVDRQMEAIRNEPFEAGTDIMKYFGLLPDDAPSKILFEKMLKAGIEEKKELEKILRTRMIPGAIDVNIMTKIDNPKRDSNGTQLGAEYSDAMSALRGFALSMLESGVVFSAGLNPRLFAYLEAFPDFFPGPSGQPKKRIILKVSDYRSAYVQGKYLAKRGLWVSEFRIESGLNCGGHAFPTEGHLLGPILEEFRQKRELLRAELLAICNEALAGKGKDALAQAPQMRISAQGGIGTAEEDAFLRNYYGLDSTGWGSPFLLVPEATNVDKETLEKLATAKKEQFYLSRASPLGVPFNNFRGSSSESQKLLRIERNRPGSPCYKEHLAFNREFTDKPLCEASRRYQHLKIAQLRALNLASNEYEACHREITEKECLCEGLSAPALLKNDLPVKHRLDAVAVCPGPNLAYFSGVFSLAQIVGHIYGRVNVLNPLARSHMFINELRMYADYLKEELVKAKDTATEKQKKYFSDFRGNLLGGIAYYFDLAKREPVFGNHPTAEELLQVKKSLETAGEVELLRVSL